MKECVCVNKLYVESWLWLIKEYKLLWLWFVFDLLSKLPYKFVIFDIEWVWDISDLFYRVFYIFIIDRFMDDIVEFIVWILEEFVIMLL